MSADCASITGHHSTVSYESQSSSATVVLEEPERLHEWLDVDAIEQLHKVFVEHPLHLLNHQNLRDALANLNIHFNDNQFNRLFLKINQNRDFKIDWNEFVSYLIFGFQDDDPSSQKEALILPISVLPVIRKSEHRSQICAITLLKFGEDDADEINNPSENASLTDVLPDVAGIWLTGSREGQIRFWTPSLEPIRVGTSESAHLKMATWVLAMQALSDVKIVCTSSTERELRFHETVASTFSLRLVIRHVPVAVNKMCYNYHSKGKVTSKLCLGDYHGNVRILEFTPFLRGPFQSKPGAALMDVFWSDVVKGKVPQMNLREYLNIHSEVIQKLYYSIRINSLYVAAEYRNTKKYRGRCPGLVIASPQDVTIFRIPLGVSSFFVDEVHNIVITGGPDTYVRIWDIYISSKPSGILTGHNGGIVMIFAQPEELKIYSIDYQKIIKVWHLEEHTLLQTYGDLQQILKAETDLVYNYHVLNRELIIAGRKLISIKCSPRVRVDITDGNTHAGPVSVVLYNKLFRNVVSCGLDSNIIVWDPWTGKRKIMMKSCHTKVVYGEIIDIEITAACFDPLEQFLLTGARDGSLRIWNYNNAVCVRNMSIKKEHEVTAVIWVVERILAVGWDQQVTEFNDVEGKEYGDPKKWPKFHTDDITCADVKLGECVASATYSGEIIFWKLETGQPYRLYNVMTPQKFIELRHHKREDSELQTSERNTTDMDTQRSNMLSVSKYVRKSISAKIHNIQRKHSARIIPLKADEEEINDETTMDMLQRRRSEIPISVQALLFLQSRPMTKVHGSIFVSLDNGMIQVYSHHQRGGYIKEFNSIHKTGDCVLAMATDRKNRYLFTGSAFGYIKIWHIQNFCIPEEEKEHICMPLTRLQFIFMRNERFLTRSKRIVRTQKEPLLLSSYKGHLMAINSIVYINRPKILLTAGHDNSCRLWSLGGRYLGTLGTPLPWKRLSPFDPVDENIEYRMPPDIKKVASSTTMKVITGIQVDAFKALKQKKKMETTQVTDTEDVTRIYGKPLKEPILGKYFKLPGKGATEQNVDLDTSLSYMPIYSHLRIHETDSIQRPPTPPMIDHVAKEEFMDFYAPTVSTAPKTEKEKQRASMFVPTQQENQNTKRRSSSEK